MTRIRRRKRPLRLLAAVVVPVTALMLPWVAQSVSVASTYPKTAQSDLAMSHIRTRMDNKLQFDVYSDWRSIGNHFTPSGWMLAKRADGTAADPSWYARAMAIEEYSTNVGTRATSQATKITWKPTEIPDSRDWAGMYWQQPNDNWGTVANGGFELSGATRISFWAKGAVGGEKIMFKAFGVGRNGDPFDATPDCAGFTDPTYNVVTPPPHPDSECVYPAGPVETTLTSDWVRYTIDLSPANLINKNLSYVIGGFAWIAKYASNPRAKTEFYLDDIRYEGVPGKRRLIESFWSYNWWTPPRPLSNNQYFYVYRDKGSSYNAYHATGFWGDPLSLAEDAPAFSGSNALRLTYTPGGAGFSALAFQAPASNAGDRPGGWNLHGATRLTFWARGAVGNERIIPKIGGQSGPFYDTLRPALRYDGQQRQNPEDPDPGVVLTNTWRQYSMSLVGKGSLSRMGSGLSIAFNGPTTSTVYVDEIRFENESYPSGTTASPIAHPADFYLWGTAHTYDNALAISAFVANGEQARARQLADALVWLSQNDPTKQARLRNVYYSDELTTAPCSECKPGTEVPRFYQDIYGAGTTTGNQAWAILALLNYYKSYGGAAYLTAAQNLAQWIVDHTYSTVGSGGYTGGYDGRGVRQTFKSTEHNIDVYAAFLRLYEFTRNTQWRSRAMWAKRFLVSMWNDTAGFFYTGTDPDGTTTNTVQRPLDVNPWAYLALGEYTKYGRSLSYSRDKFFLSSGSFSGYDYNDDLDGIWWEGTAHMATALWAESSHAAGTATGTWAANRAAEARDQLRNAQANAENTDGSAIVAASKDRLTTGFTLPGSDEPFLFYARRHIGATSWFVMSELKYNPFWAIPTSSPIPYAGIYS